MEYETRRVRENELRLTPPTHPLLTTVHATTQHDTRHSPHPLSAGSYVEHQHYCLKSLHLFRFQ